MSLRTGPTVATHNGQTDFGREMRGAGTLSLSEALRDRAWRTARAEAYRFQIAMALLGFVGGMIIVLPAVLWLASHRHAGNGPMARRIPASFADSVSASAALAPALVSAPTLREREPHQLAPAAAEQPASRSATSVAAALATAEQRQEIESARNLIRSGQVKAARDVLTQSHLAETGEASFMLAETYDPNVLAALGVTEVHAEAETARHHYEVALAKGVTAAALRLEALE